MSPCPICDNPLTEGRRRYQVVLEIDDVTRSTRQFMGNETGVRRYCVNQQLCADCGQNLRETLSSA